MYFIISDQNQNILWTTQQYSDLFSTVHPAKIYLRRFNNAKGMIIMASLWLLLSWHFSELWLSEAVSLSLNLWPLAGLLDKQLSCCEILLLFDISFIIDSFVWCFTIHYMYTTILAYRRTGRISDMSYSGFLPLSEQDQISGNQGPVYIYR